LVWNKRFLHLSNLQFAWKIDFGLDWGVLLEPR
jgi:hypothetical protein